MTLWSRLFIECTMCLIFTAKCRSIKENTKHPVLMNDTSCPLARLRIGLENVESKLKGNLSPEKRKELEGLKYNISQCIEAVEPKVIKEFKENHGRPPTRNDLMFRFADARAAEFRARAS